MVRDTPKICVVDDDQLVRQMINVLLSAKGYLVLEATDGAAGMKVLRQELPDLLITDIMMPDQDGIETICASKRDFPKTPILVMSGSAVDSGADFLGMARRLGADAHIRKPFEPAIFLEKVEMLLQHQG
jgi:DNA-binding response OmpR family regulator